MSEEINRIDLFTTPVWCIKGEVPKGAYEWALNVEKNVKGNNLSNRGGYQSQALDWREISYMNIIKKMTTFLPPFYFGAPWLNINRKGHYNVKHTHPESDLAAIWYITDNMNKLFFEDPCVHARSTLLDKGGSDEVKGLNAKAGTLVIFPADLSHWVEMNETDSPRISLSFNIKLKL